MTRLIGYTDQNGVEHVYFTEDLDSPATDFVSVGSEVAYDTTIDCEMPTEFPNERALKVA